MADSPGHRGVVLSMANGDVDADIGPIPFDPALAATRSPLYHLMLPKIWMEYVGHIALQWGVFEQMFNEFLEAMLKANSTVLPRKLLAYKFDQRRALFLDELTKLPSLTFLQQRIKALLDDAEDLFLRRNAVVHGNIAIQFQAARGPVLIVTGRHKGETIVHRYNLEEIKVLAHDLSYLAGRMGEMAKAEAKLPITQPERQQLQDFLRGNHPNPASGQMLLYWQPNSAPAEGPA